MNDFFEHEDDDSLSDLLERFDSMLSEDTRYFFDVEEYEDLIDHYLVSNELEKCGLAVKLALEQYPGQSGILIRQAQFLVSSDKAEKALRILAKVEQLDPTNSDIFITKGAIYSQMKRYADAISEYSKAIDRSEDLGNIYSSIAFEYENMGDYDNAIAYLKKVLEIEPGNETILFELAFCFEITNQPEAGIEYFTAFTDRLPYSHFAWFNLGVAYNSIELYEKAVEAFDFAIAIEPGFSSAYFNKANALAGMEHYHHAIVAFRETLEHEEPEAMTYYYIGECYEKLGELDDAISHFRIAVEMDENLADAWVGIGVCYQLQGDYMVGLRYIQKGVEIDPENPEYLASLAICQKQAGFPDKAEGTFAKATILEPYDQEIWLDFAELFAERADYVGAMGKIKEGLQNIPESNLLKWRRIALLFLEGKRKEALNQLNKMLETDQEGFNQLLEYLPGIYNDPDVLNMRDSFSL